MPIDVGAGLAQMGDTISKFTGQVALEQQKEAAEQEKIKLANDLAAQRETAGRAQEHQYRTEEIGQQQTFQAGENEKTRATTLEGHRISASATLGAASIAADRAMKVAQMETQSRIEVAKIYAGSRELVAQTNAAIKKQLADASTMSPEAVDTAARMYLNTGQLPNLGFGGQANKTAIMNRSQEIMKDEGITPETLQERQASAAGAKAAMITLDRQQQAITSFSATADANSKVLLELADKVDDSGVPVLNRWIRAGRKSLAGDPDVARFDAAMQTYISERSKILSGSMGNQAPTDSARHEVANMMNSAMTREQIAAVDATLTLETKNRLDSIDTTRKMLLGRQSGKGANYKPPEPPAHTPSNPGGLPSLPMKNGQVDMGSVRPGIPYMTPYGPKMLDPATKSFVDPE